MLLRALVKVVLHAPRLSWEGGLLEPPHWYAGSYVKGEDGASGKTGNTAKEEEEARLRFKKKRKREKDLPEEEGAGYVGRTPIRFPAESGTHHPGTIHVLFFFLFFSNIYY